MKKQLAHLISGFLVAYYKVRYGKRVHFGKHVIINHKFKVSGPGRLYIGDGANLWAHAEPNSFHFYSKDAIIRIGKNTRLNGLACHCEQSIEIGDDCLIGSAIIMDTDFHTFEDPEHILHGNSKSKPVKIGNGVWLCGQSVILKGVHLGEKSVVGFRAVVTKSFPPHVVVAGNPSRIVKSKS